MQRFLIVGMGLLMTTTNLPAQTVSLRNGAETATAGNPLQSVSGATIYEVNLRQYTPEGTFEAFRREIPRLKSLGVGILWLMPIHPIGNESRKGTLGSYYAASDYKAVNPEFGTDQDFRNLMHDAHEAGMLVILDWVANHTSPDHVWTVTHPERFTRGTDGKFVPPVPDWSDTIDLNYDEPDTHRAMQDAMEYWVREFEVDGFRCDVAELVPQEFWRQSIARLRELRPLFILAEGYEPWLYDVGFDVTYGWGLADRLLDIRNGKEAPSEIAKHVAKDAAKLKGHGDAPYRMYFTTNHDWNSWNGVALERLGDAWEAATVLTFTLPGMPLIYSGQEAGLDKMLQFFEKDPITWRKHPAADLYQKLTKLKTKNPALHHGKDGGDIEFFDVGTESTLVAFRRFKADNEVIILVNLAAKPASLAAIKLRDDANYSTLDGQPGTLNRELKPWGWLILTRAN